MLRILAIDNGKKAGFALLVGVKASTGVDEVLTAWRPFGKAAIIYEAYLRNKIALLKPDVIATASQFVSRSTTTDNGVPLFWAFGALIKIAEEMGLKSEVIQESQARSKMLGKDIPMPRGTDAKKRAIWQACRDRGYHCSGYDASDALCVALAAQERLEPHRAHLNTPLFKAVLRRRRA